MSYSFVIYDFAGYKRSGKLVPCTFEKYFKESHFELCRCYCVPTTSYLWEDEDVYFHRMLLDLEQIRKLIEEGYVIVPFSNKIYIPDLQSCTNLGLKVCFMKTKTFRVFRKVYKG